jgi:hypothetical protein
MTACCQPVGNNLGLGTPQGIGVSCNSDKDASAAAYSEDKDCSASFAVENVSCWLFQIIHNCVMPGILYHARILCS